MNNLISVSVDQDALLEIYREEVQKKLEKNNKDLVLWDTKELERRTCMNINTMQKYFFFDERFPKYLIGNKWYFPAKEAEAFLITWFEEQRSKKKRGNRA